jgi:hypothetical protein
MYICLCIYMCSYYFFWNSTDGLLSVSGWIDGHQFIKDFMIDYQYNRSAPHKKWHSSEDFHSPPSRDQTWHHLSSCTAARTMRTRKTAPEHSGLPCVGCQQDNISDWIPRCVAILGFSISPVADCSSCPQYSFLTHSSSSLYTLPHLHVPLPPSTVLQIGAKKHTQNNVQCRPKKQKMSATSINNLVVLGLGIT